MWLNERVGCSDEGRGRALPFLISRVHRCWLTQRFSQQKAENRLPFQLFTISCWIHIRRQHKPFPLFLRWSASAGVYLSFQAKSTADGGEDWVVLKVSLVDFFSLFVDSISMAGVFYYASILLSASQRLTVWEKKCFIGRLFKNFSQFCAKCWKWFHDLIYWTNGENWKCINNSKNNGITSNLWWALTASSIT